MGVMPSDGDPHDGGLRALVQELLDANLERDPERAFLITRREAVSLVAVDAGRSVTVQLLPGAVRSPGTLLVHDGEDPWAEIVVSADGAGLLELAAAPLRFGFPDLATPDGRALVRRLMTGRIRVRGLLRHLGTVRRVSRLLSVR